MKAEYVELVLLEQSLATRDGIHSPFSDRVGDVAEKTGGSVLFDIRVDGDLRIRRIAAIGFGGDGTVAILMEKTGQLMCTPINVDNDLAVAELTAWASLPMPEQVRVNYGGTVMKLLTELRKVGLIPK